MDNLSFEGVVTVEISTIIFTCDNIYELINKENTFYSTKMFHSIVFRNIFKLENSLVLQIVVKDLVL
jgi:hypothetical protein